MQVQNIAQAPNFGAVRITGLEAHPKAKNIFRETIQKHGETCCYGANFFTNFRRYIPTKGGSSKETTLIQDLQNTLGNLRGIVIKSCPDSEANKNITRYKTHQPTFVG